MVKGIDCRATPSFGSYNNATYHTHSRKGNRVPHEAAEDSANVAADGSATTAWTVRRILEWTTSHLARHGSESPRLDSEVLLAYAQGCGRVELYTRFNEVVRDDHREVMRDLVKRRAQAEPVAYLVGHREFYGLDFRVTHDTFIPRPDTETLVMECLHIAAEMPSPMLCEIGTGTGCIPIAIAKNHPGAKLTTIDQSAAATAVAEQNAETHNVADRINFLNGDLFAPLDDESRFDFVISNPPYITDAERETLQADVRLHEPESALFAGVDGLDVIRRLIEASPRYLESGGHILFEISDEQAAPCTDLLTTAEYADIRVFKDLSGLRRVMHAIAPT